MEGEKRVIHSPFYNDEWIVLAFRSSYILKTFSAYTHLFSRIEAGGAQTYTRNLGRTSVFLGRDSGTITQPPLSY